ncbi:MAG: PIG-L deacetylase family protein [Brevefilum sp.]
MKTKSVLTVFAHPDDETFRAGGTLALLAAQGIRVHTLTATHGEAGSRGTPPICSKDELPGVRAEELRCACQALGLEPPIILSYPDGQISSIEPTKILSDILETVDQVQPHSIISFSKDGLSGHPDHIAIGQYALQAFHKRKSVQAFYSLAVPQSIADALGMTQIRAVPDECITHTIDITRVWEPKLQAIRCHQTQLNESPILKADQPEQRLFLGKEHFRLLEIRPESSSQQDGSSDLLTNLGKST